MKMTKKESGMKQVEKQKQGAQKLTEYTNLFHIKDPVDFYRSSRNVKLAIQFFENVKDGNKAYSLAEKELKRRTGSHFMEFIFTFGEDPKDALPQWKTLLTGFNNSPNRRRDWNRPAFSLRS